MCLIGECVRMHRRVRVNVRVLGSGKLLKRNNNLQKKGSYRLLIWNQEALQKDIDCFSLLS